MWEGGKVDADEYIQYFQGEGVAVVSVCGISIIFGTGICSFSFEVMKKRD